MKIYISVESDDVFGDNYVRFKETYVDVLVAETGIRHLVEKYRNATKDTKEAVAEV